MSANCNGGLVNIPQALYGQNGISAYVYIAFADTVTPGNPDVVTGFSYEFPTPTSEWMAIFTTTVPINNPTAVDFDNYWVEIKGAAGVGSAGVGIEVNNSVVTGSPFTVLNFLAAGASNLTGITGADAGGGQVDLTFVTAGLNKRYYTDIISEIVSGLLIPGASYWIVDVGDGQNDVIADCSSAYYGQTYPSASFDNYPHNAGIILRAISTTELDPNGIYLARVVDRTNVPVVFVPNGSYANGDYVENYNEVFQLTSPAGTYTTDPAGDPTNWAFVPKDNNTYYNLEVQGCIYDIIFNAISARWDKYNNYLANVNSTNLGFNELIKKAFRWGTPFYAGNKINIFDNVPKSTTFRKPDYAAGGNLISLVNYSAIGEFKDNYIDQGGTYHANYEFTRFFNVNLPFSVFTGNIINSSVISNLDETVFGFTAITKNTIKDSVINKVSFQQFSDNTIINNTVLGDIFYRNIAPATASTSANALLFKTRVAIDLTSSQGICNDTILNGLGSRVYQTVAGDGTSTAVSAANIVSISLNGGSNTHYSAAGDIVFFISGPPELVNTFAPILTTPSTTSFTVAGTIASYTGAITMLIFHEAIDTSFRFFIGNTLENTVIRGINKNLNATSYFNKNDIKYTIIDNYVAHTNSVTEPWNYDSSCDPAIIEIGSSTSTNGFSNNTIEYSLFYANQIRDFYQNDISGTFFYKNGDDVSGSTGFLGVMRNNKCIGIKAVGVDGSNLVPWGTNVSQTNSSASIYFSDNDFVSGSNFINTVITEFNAVISCVLNSAARVDSWTLKGNFGGSVIIPLFTSYTGLSAVTLNAATGVYGITLEGRNPKLTGVTFGANSSKEINYTVTPRTFSRNLLRDLEIAPSGYGSDALVPSLFGDNMNMIRNITAVTGAATPTAIGTITYQTTTFTLTVQTQMPHMINATGGVYQVGVEGMTVNTVAANDAALPANNSPNGNYRTWNTSSGTIIFVTATIASIVDEYTFTCTATLTSTGRYLLHSTNAVVDGQGLPAPGAGIIGPYNDGGRDYIEFPYWFKDRKNALNNTNCSPLNSVISPDYSELTTRIALGLTDTTVPIGPALPSGTRNYYVFYNYTAASTLLYNSGTLTLTLPKYFELMGGTVIFGSHVSATYQIDIISNMPEGLPIRFVTTLGCPVQFNLTTLAAAASNRIVRDAAVASYTIRTYTFGSQYIYDEIVLMKQNGVIRILSKIIHV